jgi:hypothetical protein
MLAALSHPRIVTMHSVEDLDGVQVPTMEAAGQGADGAETPVPRR